MGKLDVRWKQLQCGVSIRPVFSLSLIIMIIIIHR